MNPLYLEDSKSTKKEDTNCNSIHENGPILIFIVSIDSAVFHF